MGQFTFVGVWYFYVPESNFLSPHGSNFALYEFGQGNGQDPANSYNVYSTSMPGGYVFQSQLNGMYLGVPPGTGLVCASVADPAQSQQLIPTPYTEPNINVTLLYLPDKVHMLAERDDETGWDWLTDQGGEWKVNAAGLQPTAWNFSDLLAGKGTGGFTLNYANLTGYVFPAGSDFTEINFSGAILDGATFDQCNLTRANFTNCSLNEATFTNAIIVNTTFNKAQLNGADFRGVELTNLKATGAILDEADFTEATLTTAEISGASLNKTVLSNATLAGGDFSNCDLRTVISGGATAVSAQSQPIVFNSAKLNFPLIKYNWQWMSLLNATIDQLPPVLSSASSPLNATGAKLSGLNRNNLRGVTLEHAVFDYALLDNMDLSGADLSSASLIQASLHGATLTDVKLPNANLSGVQLGTLSHLFTLSTSFETDLNAGPNVDAALSGQFKQNNITLSSTASLETLAAGRVWQVNDVGNNIVYTIRLESGAQVLTVYAPTAAASLVNAYLPNAVLTGANLYNVLANGIQFYGSKASIDGSAILEEAELNNSNLSSLNLTQAQLLGTNLSGSYLFNAKFNNANLKPSAGGKVANLSDANLQGADFTDAQLFGANLANAAIAINVPTKANPQLGGVYLFSLPYTCDSNTVQQYITELNAAATQFSLNPNGDAATLQKYVTALETNDLKTLKVPFIPHHIILSNNAQIQTIDVGDVWQIVDGQNSYTLWTDIDENGNTELYAAPSLTLTRAAFQQSGITVRWQASAVIDTVGQQWLLDNDSENPKNFSLGYVRFVVVLDGSVLDVYGTALRIERLGDNNQLQIDTETCNVTLLSVRNMNGDTVCPNGAKLSTNQNTGGVQWDTKWLRASTPPKPPTCVPTDNSWCPPSQQKAKHQ